MQKRTKLVNLAVSALEDMKGFNLEVLEVTRLTTVTDWMVICTGTSSRHVKSLAQGVIEKVKQAGERPRGIEGMEKSEWVLVDLGSVVVHVMQAQSRAFYQLEKLWSAPPVEEPKPRKPRAPPRTGSPKKSTRKPARKAPKR